ncbi:MAG: response regulator transcription factor, partial [Anaerolineales bacterium]|nr:response regulator transcription factor [Anaerolineales bacterium]
MVADRQEVEITGNDLDRSSLPEKGRVLIIDDDVDYVQMIKMVLRQADFDVSSAYNIHVALQKCMEIKPDVILLDLMMPDMDGYSTFHRLREVSATPIIFISAAPRDENLARSLDLGADDYISKPFHNQEVISRIRRVLRQNRKAAQGQVLHFSEVDLRLELESREVFLNGRSLRLLPREFALLKLLALRASKNVPYETITMQLWGEDSAKTRAHLKTVAFSLRRKLETAGQGINLLA